MLILTNCIPLVGVLFFGWNVFETVFLYWVESAVIGFFTLVQLVLMPLSESDRQGVPANPKLIATLAFMVHFGAFMGAHFFVIVFFLGRFDYGPVMKQIVEIFQNIPLIRWGLFSLCLSHAYSFFVNYISNKKYLQPLNKESFKYLMEKPYKRIFVMQFTVLLGAAAIIVWRLPQSMVVVLVVVKIISDLIAHKKEHESKGDTTVLSTR